MNRIVLATAAFAGLAAGVANAATTVQIDINGLSSQAQVDSGGSWVNAAFGGTTHTGRLYLTSDVNSVLAAVALNGTAQPLTSTLFSFVGEIILNNGFVDGGSFTATNVDGSSYTASIVAGVGRVRTQVGQGFRIDGLTFQGLFSGPLFAGANVNPFFSVQPLFGSFLHFAFNPDAGGLDADADIDVFATIPLPTSGALAAAGLIGLAGNRRRR
ncbi:MAG: hypothetical protein AB7G17_10700 [Phycisphaerales bacterium]